jgi:hypothetical protein
MYRRWLVALLRHQIFNQAMSTNDSSMQATGYLQQDVITITSYALVDALVSHWFDEGFGIQERTNILWQRPLSSDLSRATSPFVMNDYCSSDGKLRLNNREVGS